MTDHEKAGFEIRGRFYPMPEAFRLCDPVLVEELTGKSFDDFAERLDQAGGEDGFDPVILPGLLGVAVWQANRKWPRSKVLLFVQNVDIDEVQMHAGDDEAEEAVGQGPPGEGLSPSSPTSKPQVEASV